MSASAPAALPVPDAAGILAWLTVLIAAPCGLLVGLGSVEVQILVPYAAQLAPDATRGRVVSNVVRGLMLGIMRARRVASLVTEVQSWHAVFALSAAVMAGLAVVLRLALPPRQPAPGLRYAELLTSMSRLALRTPVLQRRALVQACLFAAFSVFWKAAALFMADTFHLSQTAPPCSPWWACRCNCGAHRGRDRRPGLSRPATGLAMLGLCLRRLVPGNVGRASPADAGLLLLSDRTA